MSNLEKVERQDLLTLTQGSIKGGNRCEIFEEGC